MIVPDIKYHNEMNPFRVQSEIHYSSSSTYTNLTGINKCHLTESNYKSLTSFEDESTFEQVSVSSTKEENDNNENEEENKNEHENIIDRYNLESLVNTSISGMICNKKHTYTLVDLIGNGSFAAVYIGRREDDKCFAIKCIPKEDLNEDQLSNQLLEAETLIDLGSHPNILGLHHIIDDNKYLFLVLDLCDIDLYDVLTQDYCEIERNSYGGLAEDDVRYIFNKISNAVLFCHDHSVYHRDLKPENILLRFNTNNNNNSNNNSNIGMSFNQKKYDVKLTDFGLCTRTDFSEAFGCGSLRYIPPECINDTVASEFIEQNTLTFIESETRVDPFDNDNKYKVKEIGYSAKANDAWAMGIILINLLFGRNPWYSASMDDECFLTFIHDDSDFLKKKFGFTDEFNEYIKKVFSFKPCDRYTLREMVNKFNEIDVYFDPEYNNNNNNFKNKDKKKNQQKEEIDGNDEVDEEMNCCYDEENEIMESKKYNNNNIDNEEEEKTLETEEFVEKDNGMIKDKYKRQYSSYSMDWTLSNRSSYKSRNSHSIKEGEDNDNDEEEDYHIYTPYRRIPKYNSGKLLNKKSRNESKSTRIEEKGDEEKENDRNINNYNTMIVDNNNNNNEVTNKKKNYHNRNLGEAFWKNQSFEFDNFYNHEIIPKCEDNIWGSHNKIMNYRNNKHQNCWNVATPTTTEVDKNKNNEKNNKKDYWNVVVDKDKNTNNNNKNDYWNFATSVLDKNKNKNENNKKDYWNIATMVEKNKDNSINNINNNTNTSNKLSSKNKNFINNNLYTENKEENVKDDFIYYSYEPNWENYVSNDIKSDEILPTSRHWDNNGNDLFQNSTTTPTHNRTNLWNRNEKTLPNKTTTNNYWNAETKNHNNTFYGYNKNNSINWEVADKIISSNEPSKEIFTNNSNKNGWMNNNNFISTFALKNPNTMVQNNTNSNNNYSKMSIPYHSPPGLTIIQQQQQQQQHLKNERSNDMYKNRKVNSNKYIRDNLIYNPVTLVNNVNDNNMPYNNYGNNTMKNNFFNQSQMNKNSFANINTSTTTTNTSNSNSNKYGFNYNNQYHPSFHFNNNLYTYGQPLSQPYSPPQPQPQSPPQHYHYYHNFHHQQQPQPQPQQQHYNISNCPLVYGNRIDGYYYDSYGNMYYNNNNNYGSITAINYKNTKNVIYSPTLPPLAPLPITSYTINNNIKASSFISSSYQTLNENVNNNNNFNLAKNDYLNNNKNNNYYYNNNNNNNINTTTNEKMASYPFSTNNYNFENKNSILDNQKKSNSSNSSVMNPINNLSNQSINYENISINNVNNIHNLQNVHKNYRLLLSNNNNNCNTNNKLYQSSYYNQQIPQQKMNENEDIQDLKSTLTTTRRCRNDNNSVNNESIDNLFFKSLNKNMFKKPINKSINSESIGMNKNKNDERSINRNDNEIVNIMDISSGKNEYEAEENEEISFFREEKSIDRLYTDPNLIKSINLEVDSKENKRNDDVVGKELEYSTNINSIVLNEYDSTKELLDNSEEKIKCGKHPSSWGQKYSNSIRRSSSWGQIFSEMNFKDDKYLIEDDMKSFSTASYALNEKINNKFQIEENIDKVDQNEMNMPCSSINEEKINLINEKLVLEKEKNQNQMVEEEEEEKKEEQKIQTEQNEEQEGQIVQQEIKQNEKEPNTNIKEIKIDNNHEMNNKLINSNQNLEKSLLIKIINHDLINKCLSPKKISLRIMNNNNNNHIDVLNNFDKPFPIKIKLISPNNNNNNNNIKTNKKNINTNTNTDKNKNKNKSANVNVNTNTNANTIIQLLNELKKIKYILEEESQSPSKLNTKINKRKNKKIKRRHYHINKNKKYIKYKRYSKMMYKYNNNCHYLKNCSNINNSSRKILNHQYRIINKNLSKKFFNKNLDHINSNVKHRHTILKNNKNNSNNNNNSIEISSSTINTINTIVTTTTTTTAIDVVKNTGSLNSHNEINKKNENENKKLDTQNILIINNNNTNNINNTIKILINYLKKLININNNNNINISNNNSESTFNFNKRTKLILDHKSIKIIKVTLAKIFRSEKWIYNALTINRLHQLIQNHLEIVNKNISLITKNVKIFLTFFILNFILMFFLSTVYYYFYIIDNSVQFISSDIFYQINNIPTPSSISFKSNITTSALPFTITNSTSSLLTTEVTTSPPPPPSSAFTTTATTFPFFSILKYQQVDLIEEVENENENENGDDDKEEDEKAIYLKNFDIKSTFVRKYNEKSLVSYKAPPQNGFKIKFKRKDKNFLKHILADDELKIDFILYQPGFLFNSSNWIINHLFERNINEQSIVYNNKAKILIKLTLSKSIVKNTRFRQTQLKSTNNKSKKIMILTHLENNKKQNVEKFFNQAIEEKKKKINLKTSINTNTNPNTNKHTTRRHCNHHHHEEYIYINENIYIKYKKQKTNEKFTNGSSSNSNNRRSNTLLPPPPPPSKQQEQQENTNTKYIYQQQQQQQKQNLFQLSSPTTPISSFPSSYSSSQSKHPLDYENEISKQYINSVVENHSNLQLVYGNKNLVIKTENMENQINKNENNKSSSSSNSSSNNNSHRSCCRKMNKFDFKNKNEIDSKEKKNVCKINESNKKEKLINNNNNYSILSQSLSSALTTFLKESNKDNIVKTTLFQNIAGFFSKIKKLYL